MVMSMMKKGPINNQKWDQFPFVVLVIVGSTSFFIKVNNPCFMSECLSSIAAQKPASFTMHSKVKKHADYRQVLPTVVLMQLADSMVQQDW